MPPDFLPLALQLNFVLRRIMSSIQPLPFAYLASIAEGEKRHNLLVIWLTAALQYCKTQERLKHWVGVFLASLAGNPIVGPKNKVMDSSLLNQWAAKELAAAGALGAPNTAALSACLALALDPASNELVRARRAAATAAAAAAAAVAAQPAKTAQPIVPVAVVKSAEALALFRLLLIRALSKGEIILGRGRRDFIAKARIQIDFLANVFFEIVQLNQKIFWDAILPILRGRERILAATFCVAEQDKAMDPLLRPLMCFLESAIRRVLESMLASEGCFRGLGHGPDLLRKLRPLRISDGYFYFEFDLQHEGTPPAALGASPVAPGVRPVRRVPDCLEYFGWYWRPTPPWVRIVDAAVALLASITRDCAHGRRWGPWTGGFSGPTPCVDCAAEKIRSRRNLKRKACD